MLLAVTTVLYTDASRYLVPVGEKYVNMIAPGSVDIHASFQAARAYLRGVNPYRNYEPDLQAGIIPAELGGVKRTYVYPPSHLLLYVPLAMASHGDPRTGAQMQFYVNLLCLGLLAWLSWLLLRALDPTAFASLAWAVVVLMVLAL